MFRFQKVKILFLQDRYDKYLKSYPWIFDMYKKEKEIFYKSLDYLEKKKDLKDRLIFSFHWYEAIINLLTDYQGKIGFSDEEISNLNISVDELSIILKHINSWYYESAYVHIRILMESIINFVFLYKTNWNIEKTGVMKKIKSSLEKWNFYQKDVDVWMVKIPYEEFFDIDNYYSFYDKLSWFVHKWIRSKELNFKEDLFLDSMETIISVLQRIWAFMYVCLWNNIKKYRNNPYKKAEDGPTIYAKPIRWLIVSKW